MGFPILSRYLEIILKAGRTYNRKGKMSRKKLLL